jgi:hypothetical protein
MDINISPCRLLSVVEDYVSKNSSSVLAAFIPKLEQVVGTGNVTQLSGLCAAWESTAKSDLAGFAESQRKIQTNAYFAPNLDLVTSLGLKKAVSGMH